jgi:catechol 2,3-dioxygenase-like lactoylglutathione lyase family enzyme
MKPSIKVLTLGVHDLEKSLAFYRDGLGLATEGIIGTEFEGGAVVFFEMNGGLILALYPKVQIAKDANLADIHAFAQSSPLEFTLGHNVNSKAEVDAVIEQARKAGSIRPVIAPGVATLDISKTLTVICGRLSGIR